MMRAWPAKTRRPHPATRTASPTSGLRPRPAEPGDYRSHGGSRRTQRTADNPPAAQSTLPPAPAFPACATPYAQARLGRQHCVMSHPSKEARSPIMNSYMLIGIPDEGAQNNVFWRWQRLGVGVTTSPQGTAGRYSAPLAWAMALLMLRQLKYPNKAVPITPGQRVPAEAKIPTTHRIVRIPHSAM